MLSGVMVSGVMVSGAMLSCAMVVGVVLRKRCVSGCYSEWPLR